MKLLIYSTLASGLITMAVLAYMSLKMFAVGF
jgi:hypothetical protein